MNIFNSYNTVVGFTTQIKIVLIAFLSTPYALFVWYETVQLKWAVFAELKSVGLSYIKLSRIE